MCKLPMASSPGVDGERGRSGFVGSPMESSALAWESWKSWNSSHFLSRFLSPDERFLSPGDVRNLRLRLGSRNSFSITCPMKTLILTYDFSSCFFPKFKQSTKTGFSRKMTYSFGLYGPKIGGGVLLPEFCPKYQKP